LKIDKPERAIISTSAPSLLVLCEHLSGDIAARSSYSQGQTRRPSVGSARLSAGQKNPACGRRRHELLAPSLRGGRGDRD